MSKPKNPDKAVEGLVKKIIDKYTKVEHLGLGFGRRFKGLYIYNPEIVIEHSIRKAFEAGREFERGGGENDKT